MQCRDSVPTSTPPSSLPPEYYRLCPTCANFDKGSSRSSQWWLNCKASFIRVRIMQGRAHHIKSTQFRGLRVIFVDKGAKNNVFVRVCSNTQLLTFYRKF